MLSAIRFVLGKLILGINRVTQPRKPDLTAEQQAALDEVTCNLALYQYAACPFCVRVRRAMRRMGMPIEIRDIKTDPRWRVELIQEGGKQQVPCLRIDSGESVVWLYESSDIVAYLEGLTPPSTQPAHP